MPITQKHKSILFSGIALMAGVTLLTGCASDPILMPKSEEYTRDFIKMFGSFDQRHDWNHATHTSVTVTTATPTEVKVMADFEGKRYIFASYTNVDGTKTLDVDIPKGVSDLIVAANGRNYDVKAGGKVSIDARAGRVVSDPTGEGSTGVTATLCEEKDWMVVPMLNATIFRRRMPEACYNAYRDGVSNDFSFRFKVHDIIVRPLYWQTNQTLEFGFFYIGDDDKPVHFPIYNMEKGTQGADMSNQALCWAPTETRSLVVNDFMNDTDFMKCLADNGVTVIDRTTTQGDKYQYINVNTLDNFFGVTSANDDKALTFACREYLTMKGIKNDPTASEDSRFNYVYRWRMTGDVLYYSGTHPEYGYDVNYQIYDNSFNGSVTQPKKDLEIIYTIYNYDYTKADGWASNDDMLTNIKMDDENYPDLISKGIKVHFDDISKTYGGYVKNGDRYLYSVSSLNEKTRWIPAPDAERTEEYWDYQSGQKIMRYPESAFIKDEEHKAFRAVTWVGNKYNWRYMSFEDGVIGDTYSRSSCDFDMQDFVFIIDNADPEYDDPVEEVVDPENPTPTPDEWQWIIACEDLGTDDFDFNDVVFSVSGTTTDAATNKTTVKVKALAAGGTLPVYLYYKDTELHPDGEEGNSEFHSWFGNYSSNQVINAASIRAEGKIATVEVDAPYTISCTNRVENGNMGGFKVKVMHKDKPEQIEATNPNTDAEIGTAPQMICVPDTWNWPKENVFILDVYSEFKNWCNDQTNTHWHQNPQGSYWK